MTVPTASNPPVRPRCRARCWPWLRRRRYRPGRGKGTWRLLEKVWTGNLRPSLRDHQPQPATDPVHRHVDAFGRVEISGDQGVMAQHPDKIGQQRFVHRPGRLPKVAQFGFGGGHGQAGHGIGRPSQGIDRPGQGHGFETHGAVDDHHALAAGMFHEQLARAAVDIDDPVGNAGGLGEIGHEPAQVDQPVVQGMVFDQQPGVGRRIGGKRGQHLHDGVEHAEVGIRAHLHVGVELEGEQEKRHIRGKQVGGGGHGLSSSPGEGKIAGNPADQFPGDAVGTMGVVVWKKAQQHGVTEMVLGGVAYPDAQAVGNEVVGFGFGQGGGGGPHGLGTVGQGGIGVDPAAFHGDVARAQVAFFQNVHRKPPGVGQADDVVVQGPLVAHQQDVGDLIPVEQGGGPGRPVQPGTAIGNGVLPVPMQHVASAEIDLEHPGAARDQGQAQATKKPALRSLEKQKRPVPRGGSGPGARRRPGRIGLRRHRPGIGLAQGYTDARRGRKKISALRHGSPCRRAVGAVRPGSPRLAVPPAAVPPPDPRLGALGRACAGWSGKSVAGPAVPPPRGR